ncbi:hypothetical protein GGS23DRAFT_353137 [Durotheca rogersii]|uniref:uncharacterized protein n=1 Tax=Durotheca rogersii TaxID=419775 RepID=UPI00221E822C|nr:uncharacterized protein GGS23DRAFT_353137 [Durotheca rogersii]KAI5865743.1 hypothetical protein GGS23DRAFT_353137 [Durotheca rogersii]
MVDSANQVRPKAGSGPQNGTFSYFKYNPEVHDYEKPFEILINLPSIENDPERFRRTNQQFEDRTTVVEDVRGREDQFTLDKQSVCWRKWEGPKDWAGLGADAIQSKGHDWIRDGYIKDVEQFIKLTLESQDGKPIDFVKVFDYKLRSSLDMENFHSRTLDLNNGLDRMIPVTHPHVDQSYKGAITRLEVHLPEDAERLRKTRFRIVNVWKPLTTATNWPLAICDSSTVREEDLVTTDLVRRKYVGETFYSRFNPRHKWYYLSNQEPNEVTMLKIHDSSVDARVRFCLHSSFKIEGVEDCGRESFEVRAFVFDKEE